MYGSVARRRGFSRRGVNRLCVYRWARTALYPLCVGVIATLGCNSSREPVAVASVELPRVTVGSLEVSDLVIPAQAGDAPLAMYFTVASSAADTLTVDTLVVDTLLSVSVEGVDAALHDSRDGGMQSAGALVVSAGSPILFRPGGLHAMFTLPGLRPVAGDSLNVKIVFAMAGTAEVRAVVREYSELERLLDNDAHAH